MRTFLPKLAYRNLAESTNLAGALQTRGLDYTPLTSLQHARTHDSYTRSGYFREAVSVHALQAVEVLTEPATLGIAVAALATGGATLAGYAAMRLSGTGAEMSPEIQHTVSQRLGAMGLPDTAQVVANLSELYKFGLLGLPERAARNRAEAAHDAGRGLAHAAWTGLAVGLHALLWVPRLASACLNQATVLSCALVGAVVGAVRFCIDTVAHGRVRWPAHYLWGAGPCPDYIAPPLTQLAALNVEDGWLSRVFEDPGEKTLASAREHLERMRAAAPKHASASLDDAISSLATGYARERNDDPEAHRMLRQVARAFFGDIRTPAELGTVFRRRSLSVHPDKGLDESVRVELMRAMSALRDRIENLPTLHDVFFPRAPAHA